MYYNEFQKFISYENCTFEEFKKARNYLEIAKYKEKNNFYNTCFKIVREVLKLMMEKEATDYLIGKDIFESHGLTENDFREYYNLFMNKFIYKQQDNYNSLAKEIWEEAKLYFWDPKVVTKIGQKYDFTQARTYAIISYYFRNDLHFEDFSEYKSYYKTFNLFLNLKLTADYEFQYAYKFYCEYATAEEKEAFKNTTLKILNDAKAYLPDNLLKYSKMLNIKLSDLYFLASLFNANILPDIINYFKAFYDFCATNLWQAPPIKEEAKKQNIKYLEFLKMSKIYATEVLGITNIEEYINQIRTFNIPSRFTKADIINQILKSTNEEEYFPLFKTSNVRENEIYHFCYIYNKALPKETKEQMEKDLKLKLKNYQKRKIHKSNPKTISEDILIDALNSTLTIKEFCKLNNLNYRNILTIFNNSKNKALLEEYKNKIAREKQKREENLKSLVLCLLNYIKNGFPANNTVYPFELIDFYILFPNINPKTIKTGFLSREDALVIQSIFASINNAVIISKNSILSSTITKQITINNNTFIHTFTEEELTKIIAFMDYYNIPFNDLLFNEVCNRYLTNTLTLYTNDNLVLK